MANKEDIGVRRSNLSQAKLDLLEMRARGMGKSGQSPYLISPRPSSEPLELSSAQVRLWFLNQLDPSHSSYNLFSLIRLEGPLDIQVFEQAINEIVRRHEVLRTVFVEKDGSPCPVLIPHLTMKVSLINLFRSPLSLRSHAMESLSRDEVRRPFRLNQGPLFRAVLFQLDVHHHVFLLTMHHIISDQWSLDIMMRELSSLYKAFFEKRSSLLPELPLQYNAFAYWQNTCLKEKSMQGQLQYWKNRLSNCPPPIQLPFSRAKKKTEYTNGALRSLELSQALSAQLQDLRRQRNTTLFSLFLSAFVTLLYRYSGQTDIVVGTPIANRNQDGLELLIGFFLNTVVLRFDMSDNPIFQVFLNSVHEEVMNGFSNQEYPFEKLVAELNPERSPWGHPFFEIMYVYQAYTEPMNQLDDVKATPLHIDVGTSKFDLTLFVTEQERTITLSLEYRTDLFDDLTIIQVLGDLQSLLEEITQDSAQQLSEFTITSFGRCVNVLLDEKPYAVEPSQNTCWLHWFDQHVQRNPYHQAIVHGPDSLNYQQLNSKANQLAQYLINHGVGPEALVPIVMDRSLDMIVGLLGVQKAGGAYVPLDPGVSHEMLARVFADIQAPLVLTQAKFLERLNELDYRKVCLDSGWDEISQHSRNAEALNVIQAQHLAYVIYTSGSTGKPKGVRVTHENLASSTQARLEYYSPELRSF